MNQFSFKSLIVHFVALLIFVIAASAYFAPQFSGKKINQSDTLLFLGMSEEINKFHEETGEWTQWTNSGFGGMPSYQIKSPNMLNLTRHIKDAMSVWLPRPAGMFIFGSVCFYLMALVLGVHPWLGIFGALAFSFTTNNVVLFEAGHNTKILTVMTSPLVIAGVLLTYKEKWLEGVAIFSLGMALCFNANHPQMTYYLGLLLGIYVLIKLGASIKNRTLPSFAKASGLLLIGLIIGFGTSATKLLPTYEYSKDTMRGKPILATEGVAKSSSEVDGLEWNYATAWSNGWADLWPSYIPMAVGGSTAEKISPKSALGKELKKRGMNTEQTPMPMYFGDLSSTSGPIYFGAIICFLFLLSFSFLEPKLRWWGVASVLLTMFLSLGNNMEFLYRIFFDYFPFFNKFRTPNSILSVTAVIFPMIGILALNHFFKVDRKSINKMSILIPAGVLGIGALALAFIGPSIMSFEGKYDSQLIQAGIKASVIEDTRISIMQTSAYRSFALIAIAATTCFLYLRGIIKANIAMIIIGVFALGDLFLIDKNYVNNDDFVTERSFAKNFEKRTVDETILKDKDPHYRVFDISSGNPWNYSRGSYYHKSIGGMHAAKLQRYDDMINMHLGQSTQEAFDMLNTKYIIGQSSEGTLGVQTNPTAAGNAWFVNNIQMVDNANEEIAAISGLNVQGTAIVHKEFSDYVGGFKPQKIGTIKLETYAPNKLVYKSNTSSDQFAVFSEVWYGPNKGWEASIDGEPVEHIRANYILRALKVPAGQHEIVFEFKPKSYTIGKIITLISSLLIIALLAFWAFSWFKNGGKLEEESVLKPKRIVNKNKAL